MTWDWQFVREILPLLLDGFQVSIKAALAGMAIALVVGLLLALGRRSRIRLLGRGSAYVIEFIRTTPLLVQLFFLFYVLPSYGLTMTPFVTGVIGLGLYYSAYTAEVYRAGIEGVPRGQWDAATALNFSWRQTLLEVVLPQALPPIVPALGNYLIMAFKQSSLLAAITVVELVQTANIIGSRTFRFLEPFTLVGLLYVVVSYISSLGIQRIEVRLGQR